MRTEIFKKSAVPQKITCISPKFSVYYFKRTAILEIRWFKLLLLEPMNPYEMDGDRYSVKSQFFVILGAVLKRETCR